MSNAAAYRVLDKVLPCTLIVVALTLATTAQAKNMFYLLAADWCAVGRDRTTKAFTIDEDGSLIYDLGVGRVCQISSATNMESPTGTYNVVWICGSTNVPDRLQTYMTNEGDRRRFFLVWKPLNVTVTPQGTDKIVRRTTKKQTFEQCEPEPEK